MTYIDSMDNFSVFFFFFLFYIRTKFNVKLQKSDSMDWDHNNYYYTLVGLCPNSSTFEVLK